MKVYRLEKDGLGPYVSRAPFYRSKVSKQKVRRARHVQRQAMQQSMISWKKHQEAVKQGYHFGTRNKELLKAYFGYNLKPYFAAGFRIKEYEIPDIFVIDMGVELAFKKPIKKLVWLKPIDKP